MAGIHVLLDLLKVGNSLEKTSTPKGKTAAESVKNATTGFAEILSGKIKPNADSKGQSSKAGQDSEEKQSVEDTVQSTQNQDGLVSMLGYGNFALPFLIQSTLQSDLPAGKEANSGNEVSQGAENSSTAISSLTNALAAEGNNLGLAMLNLLSLASNEVSVQSGMTAQKTQGGNPGITELDKYRQVIADLLKVLSGEITDNSPKGTLLSLESAGTNNLSQDMAKIVQGWLTLTDYGAKDGLASTIQMGIRPLVDVITAGIGNDNPVINEKISTLIVALDQKLSQGSEGVGGAKASQGMNAMIQLKDTDVHTNGQQKSDGIGPKKGDSTQSTELSVGKDVQNQNSSAGIGVASNIVASNVAEGKTTAVPVWEQISTVLREQVMNRSQDLKQLDIQLHPADLGKIQIALHWENGQVHLQVQASEAATGQLLQNQLSDLRQTLSNQGVNCGSLQMGQGGERQQNPHGDESQRTFNQNTHSNEDENVLLVTNPNSLGQDETNQINVTA